MELTEEQKSQLKELGKELAISVAAEVAFSAATSLIKEFLTTNYEKNTLSGNKIAAPTEDKALLDKKEADGNSNEGAIAKDDVRAQQGGVKGSDTDVDANSNEALASETGAKALQTSAGATEIAAKALKMN